MNTFKALLILIAISSANTAIAEDTVDFHNLPDSTVQPAEQTPDAPKDATPAVKDEAKPEEVAVPVTEDFSYHTGNRICTTRYVDGVSDTICK